MPICFHLSFCGLLYEAVNISCNTASKGAKIDKLERTVKEAIMAWQGYYPGFYQVGLRKNSAKTMTVVEWNQQTRNHVSWLHLYMHWKHCF